MLRVMSIGLCIEDTAISIQKGIGGIHVSHRPYRDLNAQPVSFFMEIDSTIVSTHVGRATLLKINSDGNYTLDDCTIMANALQHVSNASNIPK